MLETSDPVAQVWALTTNTVNSEAQVPVLLFVDCAFAWYELRGVLFNEVKNPVI